MRQRSDVEPLFVFRTVVVVVEVFAQASGAAGRYVAPPEQPFRAAPVKLINKMHAHRQMFCVRRRKKAHLFAKKYIGRIGMCRAVRNHIEQEVRLVGKLLQLCLRRHEGASAPCGNVQYLRVCCPVAVSVQQGFEVARKLRHMEQAQYARCAAVPAAPHDSFIAAHAANKASVAEAQVYLADFFSGVFLDRHHSSCAPVAEAFHDHAFLSCVQTEKEFACICLHSAAAGQHLSVLNHKDGLTSGDGAQKTVQDHVCRAGFTGKAAGHLYNGSLSLSRGKGLMILCVPDAAGIIR